VLFGRIAALHDAEIGRAGADVDDQGVQERFQTVGHSERLGDEHHAVGDPFYRIAQILPADPESFCRHAYHGAHLRFVLAFLLDARERDQMAQDLLHGLLIFFGAIFHNAALERPAQIEHGPVIESLAADEHGFFYQLARDHVDRPADVAIDDVTLAGGRGDRASRSAEID